MVRTGEELCGHVEGREADLSMLLSQLRHQQVVDMLNVVVRGSERRHHSTVHSVGYSTAHSVGYSTEQYSTFSRHSTVLDALGEESQVTVKYHGMNVSFLFYLSDTLQQCFSTLVLRTHCPECFRYFPTPTHLIQMNVHYQASAELHNDPFI